MMQPWSGSNTPEHRGVIDSATLYLCRQGPQWVVVIESPRVTDAVPLHHAGRDTYDAQFELLASARRACPDAAIMSTDGALNPLTMNGGSRYAASRCGRVTSAWPCTASSAGRAATRPERHLRPALPLGSESILLGPAAHLLTPGSKRCPRGDF